MSSNLKVLNHPLIALWISHIRDRESDNEKFRKGISILSNALFVEAGGTLKSESYPLETPVGPGKGWRIAEKIALVPILRAALGMVGPILDWVPEASVYHFGVARDHNTLKPGIYYDNIPVSLADKNCFVLDPMIATGGSAIEALSRLDESKPKQVSLLGIIGARAGIEKIQARFPQVRIFLAAMDENLNAKGYITPGLGDAGDRCFNS